MCDMVSALAAVGGMMFASTQQSPNIPAPVKPDALPQASQVPDAQGVRAGQSGAGQAGGAPGIAQTFLTGTGGVDPDSLKLGKTSLLGA